MKISDTKTYLGHLFRDAGRVELRHQIGKRWETSWHLDPDDLLITARSKARVGNLFTSLNHVGTWRPEPVGNDDIDRYCRILFDFDPERPTGTASTDENLGDARTRVIGLRRHLSGHGWPMPMIAMSGNGFHLQYRVALPNTPETREQLTVIYSGLDDRFGDDVVSFDRSVRNPGRICTLYGAIKRKGPGTKDRPHRQSRISIPPDWGQVRARQIEQLASIYAKKPSPAPTQGRTAAVRGAFSGGKGDYRTLDVIGWFTSHSAYVQPLGGNVHGVRCPWSDEHSTESPSNGADTVIFEADHSWPGFACKHSHCDGRTIRDVIALWGDADQFCRETFVNSTGNISSGGQCHV